MSRTYQCIKCGAFNSAVGDKSPMAAQMALPDGTTVPYTCPCGSRSFRPVLEQLPKEEEQS